MGLPERFKSMTSEALEEWFLGAVEAEPPALDDLFAVLEHLGRTHQIGLADSWAELLQGVLAGQPDDRPALRLLKLRYDWHRNEAGFRDLCLTAARTGFASRIGKAFVKALDGGQPLPLPEWMRRIELLFALEPGILCYDRTWGFGVVKRLDDFYGKVAIDFSNKHGHEMTFGYASETLRLIGHDHLLARNHHDRDGLRKLVHDDAAEVVRIALRSYGPLTVQQLKEALVDAILPEADWKRFWDDARKALKGDPLVEIPARRTDAIQLLAEARAYDDEWFARLIEERDAGAIFRRIDEIEGATDVSGLADAHRAALADRLAFVVWGAEGKQPDLVVRALLTAVRLSLFDEDGMLGMRRIPLAGTLDRLLRPGAFLAAVEASPARLLTAFLELLAGHDAAATAAAILGALGQMTLGTLTASIAFLKARGQAESVREVMAGAFHTKGVSVAQVFWMLKGSDRDLADGVAGRGALLMQAVERVEDTENGDHLRTQNQLRALLEDGAWMAGTLAELSADEREMLLHRVRFSRGWDEVGRRTVIAGMVKAYPELQRLLVNAVPKPVDAGRGRMTSWRSYRERQHQLKVLVEEEIPANAREIAVARSYGDLRENAEFKFAKEHQRVLYRRRDECEADLEAVKGTDFSGVDSSRVGLGTCVTIRRPSGTEERYCILGEWDRDESLGIVSNRAKLAEMLAGKRPGDLAELPAAAGSEMCQVLSVTGLTDEIKAWLNAGQGC